VVEWEVAAETFTPEEPVSEAQPAHTGPAAPAEVLRPLDEAQSVLEQLQAAAHVLRVKLERAREWRPRVEVAQAELAAVRAECDGLRVHIEELQARIKKAERLEVEIWEARDELERLRGQLRDAEPLARQLEALRDEAAQLRDQMQGLRVELAARTLEVERLTKELASARAESEAAAHLRDRSEALERERDRLASRLDEQEQAHNEAEQSLRHEIEQLQRASEQACLDASAATSRAESLACQVAAFEDDLRRQRLEREQEGRVHQERFASLMSQLESTQADARRVAEPEVAELRSRLTQALSQSQAATERADRLEAELRAAHEQIALNHGLVLAQYYESGADQSKPAAVTASDTELASARNRIEELDRQLQAAQQANQDLNSLLSSLGVWDESR
jgi:chromosome segregation ATPase